MLPPHRTGTGHRPRFSGFFSAGIQEERTGGGGVVRASGEHARKSASEEYLRAVDRTLFG